MAPNRAKTLAEQIADLDDPAPKDFDPEEEPAQSSGSEDESDDGDDDIGETAREHYADVGKSKLRKPTEVSLGPQYAGAKVTRDAMLDDDDDEDNPFSKGFDEAESDEGDEDEGEDEDEDDIEEDAESEDEDEELDGDETPASEVGDEDDEEEDSDEDEAPKRKIRDDDIDRAELKRLMAEEQKSVASTLTEAAKADAEKGRAVKRQRLTFDTLLNTRIKMQKALVGTNTLAGLAESSTTDANDTPDSAFRAAETAAFNLWQSLTSLRDSMTSAQTGHKRKATTFDSDTPTSELWSYTRGQETASQSNRNQVLEKWSAKARGAATMAPRNRLNPSANVQPSITDVLNTTISTSSDRFLKRARTPRSCAPYQVAQKQSYSEAVYDDADFYGVLLQSLLEQRNSDLASTINFDVSKGYQMRREAKTKKDVDVKASKGRKLKYTVHEKLQNFMAPEDRGTWGERQAEELFGSLLGRRMVLDENEDQAVDVDGDDTLGEEEALMLFRN
ncbi:hypothetical protein MBLNU457_4243t1 [Dothideomycetes sp. NU457]